MKTTFEKVVHFGNNSIHRELRRGFDNWVRGLRSIVTSSEGSLRGDLKKGSPLPQSHLQENDGGSNNEAR